MKVTVLLSMLTGLVYPPAEPLYRYAAGMVVWKEQTSINSVTHRLVNIFINNNDNDPVWSTSIFPKVEAKESIRQFGYRKPTPIRTFKLLISVPFVSLIFVVSLIVRGWLVYLFFCFSLYESTGETSGNAYAISLYKYALSVK